jgi:endonuclease/exonuclease/phosphatase family metal-dependent hydrolase
MRVFGRGLVAAACLLSLGIAVAAEGATPPESPGAAPTPATSPTAAPPPAPTPLTGLHVVSATDRSVSVDWADQPAASFYHYQVARSASMGGATDVAVRPSQAVVAHLAPITDYYVRVRGVDAARHTIVGWSPVIHVGTKAPAPPSGLRPIARTHNSVTIDWADQHGAAFYHYQLARSASMVDFTDTAVKPSAAGLFGLTAGRDYFVRVRGVDPSGRALGGWSAIVHIRTGPPPPAPSAPILTVASFNVRCALCYSRLNEEQPWAKRRDVVVKQIISRRPDVIGLQEASQGRLPGTRITQFADLRSGLRDKDVPYELTNAYAYNCENAASPISCSHRDRGASQGTRIMYNARTVELKAQGSKLLPSCDNCNPRYLAWAILKQRAGGRSFFVADVQTQWMPKFAALRVAEMRATMDEIARRNPKRLPVFVAGDLNSTRYQSPSNAPYDEVIRRGFTDPLGHTPKSPVVSAAATAERRIRANYNSHNNFLRKVARFADWQNGSNIDYILTTRMRILLWETVLDIDAKDRIVGTIPSDHNMILVKALVP